MGKGPSAMFPQGIRLFFALQHSRTPRNADIHRHMSVPIHPPMPPSTRTHIDTIAKHVLCMRASTHTHTHNLPALRTKRATPCTADPCPSPLPAAHGCATCAPPRPFCRSIRRPPPPCSAHVPRSPAARHRTRPKQARAEPAPARERKVGGRERFCAHASAPRFPAPLPAQQLRGA